MPSSGAQSAASVFSPVTPVRALDTRDSGFKAAAGVAYTVPLASVASNATAAAVNVTVNAPDGDGYITLTPAGSGLPLASNLNFSAGETTANAAIVAVTGGSVTYMSSVNAHVVIDVSGYWTPAGGSTTGGRYEAVTPYRAVDTRNTNPIVPGETRTLSMSSAGVPGDARAVAVTLTVTGPAADGPVVHV